MGIRTFNRARFTLGQRSNSFLSEITLYKALFGINQALPKTKEVHKALSPSSAYVLPLLLAMMLSTKVPRQPT